MSTHKPLAYRTDEDSGIPRPARILVVDDRPTSRAVVKGVLHPPHYQVMEANSGVDALKLIDEHEFDLVILDIVMPDMDGIEVLKAIRTSHSEIELPVIMVTVKRESSDTVAALDVGANDYVAKPIDFPVLFARIQAQLSRKRAEDALREAHEQLENRVAERTAELVRTNETLRDEIAERVQVEAALRRSEKRFKDFADIAADWFWEMNAELRFTYLSERFQEVTGWLPNQVLGRTRVEIFASRPDEADKWARHFGDLEAHRSFEDLEFLWERPDGSTRVLRLSGKPTFDQEGQFLGYRGVGRDVTEAHVLSEQLSYHATHDVLTGLVNRNEFEHRLHRVLEAVRLRRVLETVGADEPEHVLCYLDLDQFKLINDTCGHIAGDELLRQVAKALLENVRAGDTIARLGGDEFGVLMEHCSLTQAEEVANNLRTAVQEFQFVWEEKRFGVGVSIGLVSLSDMSESISSVLSAADSACYAAKDQGRNRVHIYHDDDEDLARRYGEMQWVERINRALEEERFHLYKQPIIPISGSKDEGAYYELLLRMEDEHGHIVPPGAFLPAAERYNLATKLDRWVVQTALRWLTQHQDHLADLYQCSINLSGHSLGDEDFLAFVTRQFRETDVPPDKLCFEVTETAAIANLVSATRFIRSLKELGCRFSLDDFGSGLSSFAYLKNLPVDVLKIDGMFVKDIVSDPIDLAMVRSINEIGQVMGKKTIAEFVEDEGILEKLRETGVDYAQGFCVGVPYPIDG